MPDPAIQFGTQITPHVVVRDLLISNNRDQTSKRKKKEKKKKKTNKRMLKGLVESEERTSNPNRKTQGTEFRNVWIQL